jgi:hypothetical protein
VAREYAMSNPCSKLGISADDPEEKDEISAEEETMIRELLKAEPEWMRISFEIAMHQGCRFSETCVPTKDVNLDRKQITSAIKGGHRHTTSLVPALRPMMERFNAEGWETTFEMPTQRARHWHRFFHKNGMGHLSFHCTRVSVITRLARANISEQKVMRFIGHATLDVHRIYQKLKTDDLEACVLVLRVCLQNRFRARTLGILAWAKARRGMIFKQYQTEKQRRPTPKDPRHRRNEFYKHTLKSGRS